MEMIVLWWGLFAGTHMVGSSLRVRTALIRSLGRPGFKGLYSVVALATFIPLCLSYGEHRGTGPLLFSPPPSLQIATLVLVVLAFLLLLQGLATPTPMSTQAEMSGMRVDEARGIHRITRHSQNWAFILFALGHMLVVPYGADWVFFGGFVLYSLVSAFHQDRRLLAEERDGFGTFYLQTSLWPFGAILQGRQKLVLKEMSLPAAVIALLVSAGLCYFHASLFGGEPAFW